jgi:hypothetical protein
MMTASRCTVGSGVGSKREPSDNDDDSERTYGVAMMGADAWEESESRTTMMATSGHMVGVAMMGADAWETRESRTMVVTASGHMVGEAVTGTDVRGYL